MNFSGEPTCDDSYGHGTFMAGIIAGNGSASLGRYVGMAPNAKIVSVKIAGATGASDVSTIIAAIQWVVSFKDTYGIRVLNLSLGTDSTQSYTIDPLDYAVERAWSSGIVVNVAASNRGPAASTISDPANDPFVLTVGAIDDKGSAGLNDDVLPNFTGRGPTATDGLAKPDVVAPGAHIVSLAAPGAAITTQFPSTMAPPYRRGSGTSMATAVVTGLVAQMLSLQPALTPDRVKYELTSTAHPDASRDVMAVGSGVVDGAAALSAGPGLANVGVPASTGTGSLAASRGTVGVVLDDTNATVLDATSGNLTQQLTTWDPASLQAPWDGSSWFGSSWFGSSWFGSSWFGSSWFGSSWFGSSWFGSSWFGQPSSTEDYGSSWFGSSWFGSWDQ
jgi:serine protease AprX